MLFAPADRNGVRGVASEQNPLLGLLAAGGALSPEGPAAREIAALWWVMFWLGLAVFALFVVLLARGLFRGRARDTDTDVQAVTPASRRRWLVFGGVVMPAVVLVVVLVATVETMADLQTGESPDALQVEIVGHRWWWEVSYPDAGVTTANEIHVPVGQPVEFTLTSADVIHSFWVPQLAGKLDLFPEDENVLVLQADVPRVYRSQCAEFCGLQHANMGFVVVAEPPAEFQAWLDAQSQPPAEPAAGEAEQGQQVFLQSNCVDCHAVRGTSTPTKPGPDLTHFAGRTAISAALLPDTPQQLREWIADPQHFKEGTSMPAADLSDGDLDALVTYLRGLE